MSNKNIDANQTVDAINAYLNEVKSDILAISTVLANTASRFYQEGIDGHKELEKELRRHFLAFSEKANQYAKLQADPTVKSSFTAIESFYRNLAETKKDEAVQEVLKAYDKELLSYGGKLLGHTGTMVTGAQLFVEIADRNAIGVAEKATNLLTGLAMGAVGVFAAGIVISLGVPAGAYSIATYVIIGSIFALKSSVVESSVWNSVEDIVKYGLERFYPASDYQNFSDDLIQQSKVVIDLFGEIDATLSRNDVIAIIEAAANDEKHFLGNIIGSVAELFGVAIVKEGGVADYVKTANNISAYLKDNNLTHKYDILASENIGLDSALRGKKASIYALANLNPFIITGRDAASENALYQAHDQHGELSLLSSTNPNGQITVEYLTARSQMLDYLLEYNQVNNPYNKRHTDNSAARDAVFTDVDSSISFEVNNAVNLNGFVANQIQFGAADKTNFLMGGDFDDKLFGGFKNDILVGGKGDDYIEGRGGYTVLPIKKYSKDAFVGVAYG